MLLASTMSTGIFRTAKKASDSYGTRGLFIV